MEMKKLVLRTHSQSQNKVTSGIGRLHSNRRGATAVEFAVASVVLFLLVFGTIEFIRIGMVRHAIDNASYEAARRVIVLGASASEAEESAEVVLRRNGIENATITVSPNPITESTTRVSVQVDAPMDGNEWGPNLYGRGMELSSTTTLHTERPPLMIAKSLPPAPVTLPPPPTGGPDPITNPITNPITIPIPLPPPSISPPSTSQPQTPPAPRPPSPPKPPKPPKPKR